MLIAEKKTAVVEQIEALCRTIVEQPMFQEIQSAVDAFANDVDAHELYDRTLELQDRLEKKHQQGETLTPAEMTEFESERDTLFANPVAHGYIQARQQIAKVQNLVGQYVSTTFDLGRVPTPEDFKSGGCGCGGKGCGC